ncbi:rhodanese-like domain-containing protein [Polaribacter sp. R77954]|uniref:rhodanese-like domain-containing protein n=1 Tax=Polaribacter sp. R77954 TaxID=3093870 RepID=UPI0037C69E27
MRSIFCILLMFLGFTSCSSQNNVKSITTVELKALLKNEQIQLLDVRSPKEIEQGFIKTAKFANYFDHDFFKQASKQLDKNKAVYLYCRSGRRSSSSAKILQEKGYNVYNVLGGYNQWKKEN